MGVEQYLLASTLALVLGQRLVRRLCPVCRIAKPIPQSLHEEVRQLGIDPDRGRIHCAGGCAACRGSGYSGRLAIVELLLVD
ncbi:type II/IV secretion system protein, partial [Acinetobacter baumannii]